MSSEIRSALVALAHALADNLEAKARRPRRRTAVAPPQQANDIDRALAKRVLNEQGIAVPKKKGAAQ